MRIPRSLALAAAAAAMLFSLPSTGFTAAPPPGSPTATAPVPRHHGARRRHPGLPKVFQQLGLTEDQKAQILTIILAQRTEVKALREDTTLSRPERAEKIRAANSAANQKVAAILGPEKTRLLNKLRIENAAETRLKRMTTELGLTDDQQKQLKTLFIDEGTQLQALQDDNTLTNRERGQKRRAIGKDFTTKIMAVLTPEQIAKLRASRRRTPKNATGTGSPVAPGTNPKP